MRGLLMAFFAFDFPGHRAGRAAAFPAISKTTATKTAKAV